MSAEETTMNAVPGRRERRKQQVRERLVQAAIELFGKHGFQQTTVEDITEAADVGKGTFFNYFPSKEHVLGALVEIQIGRVNEGLASARTGRSSAEVLHDLMRAMPRLPGRSRVMTRSMLGGLAGSATVRSLILPGLERGRDVLAEVFRLGQQRGEIRTDIDAKSLSVAFQQTILGALAMWSIVLESELDPIVENTFTLFWAGVRAPNASERKQER